jgi:hypothetical protein
MAVMALIGAQAAWGQDTATPPSSGTVVETYEQQGGETPALLSETQPEAPPPPESRETAAAMQTPTVAGPPTATFTVESFVTDLFTGAARAEIPILVPAGAAGVGPKIVLR